MKGFLWCVVALSTCTTSKKASPSNVTSRTGPLKLAYTIREPAFNHTVDPSGRIVLVLLPFGATTSLAASASCFFFQAEIHDETNPTAVNMAAAQYSLRYFIKRTTDIDSGFTADSAAASCSMRLTLSSVAGSSCSGVFTDHNWCSISYC